MALRLGKDTGQRPHSRLSSRATSLVPEIDMNMAKEIFRCIE